MKPLKQLFSVAGLACAALAVGSVQDVNQQPMPDLNQVVDNTPDSI